MSFPRYNANLPFSSLPPRPIPLLSEYICCSVPPINLNTVGSSLSSKVNNIFYESPKKRNMGSHYVQQNAPNLNPLESSRRSMVTSLA